MTTPVQIPDAAVRAAQSAFNEFGYTAAYPHLPLGYEVKQLEWHDDSGDAYVNSEVGRYEINETRLGFCISRNGYLVDKNLFETLETAKAAAQADHDRRVRECVTLTNEGAKPVDVAAVRGTLEYVDRMFLLDLGSYIDQESDVFNQAIFDTYQRVAATIRALSAEPAQGEQWQPIDPKLDGTEYLTWNGRRYHVAKFDKVENEWVSSFTTVTRRLPISPQPTHFSPLPAAPTPEAGK